MPSKRKFGDMHTSDIVGSGQFIFRDIYLQTYTDVHVTTNGGK